MNVALYGGQDDAAALGGVRFFHELFEMTDRGLHRFSGLQNFRDDELVGIKEAANFSHAGHERTVDDVERRDAFSALAVEVGDEAVAGAFDDVAGEVLIEREVCGAGLVFFLCGAEMLGDGGDVELIDGGALFFRLLAPIGGNIAEERGFRMVDREFRGRMREEKIFGEAALVFGDRGEAFEFFGVDDGEIETGFGAVIEEDGIYDFARARGQAEGDVGNAEDGARVWKGALDEADAFHGFDRAADIVFVARGAGKDERIENDVFGREAVFFGEQLVAALGDSQLALAGKSLGLELVFINAAAHDGGAEIVSDGNNFLELFLAIFEVDGIDDGFALAIREGPGDGAGVGGVDHHRRFYFADEFFVERRNVLLLVALGALQADVDNVRATAYLAAGNFAGFFPLFFGDEIFEEAGADDVGALAHEQGARAVLGFDGLDAGIDGAVLFRGTMARLFAFGHLRKGADVLLGGAAAAADEIEPAVIDKFLELGSERCWRLEVLAFFVGQPGVGIAGDTFAGELAERANVVGHEFRAGGAVHAEGERLGEAQRSPHGFDGLSGEHGAHGLDGDGDDEGNGCADFAGEFLDGQQSGFDVAGVLTGFDEEDVDAALEQAFGLDVVGFAKLLEGDTAGDGDGLGGGAHGTGDKARLGGRGEFVGGLASEFGGAAVEEMRVGGEPVLGENNGGTAKAVCFNDVGAGREIFAVDVEDDVWARAHEIFVTAFERGAAEILGGEIALLQHGTHGAVEHKDALRQEVAKGSSGFGQITHG